MPLKLKNKHLPGKLDHQRFTTLINSMTDAVIALDAKARIVLYNSAALSILDVNNLKELTPLERLFKPINKNNQPVDVNDLVKSARTPIINRDLRLRYSDGSIINLYLSVAPEHVSYGEAGQEGYVLILRDITREKSLEEERDEFISVVSHELRTPVAIAEGNISNTIFIAEHNHLPASISQPLKEAHSQVIYLSEMINDLATLSRAERGKLQVEIEAINVHDLITELDHAYQPEASNKGLELKSVIDPSLELLYSSRLYVREILQNFLTNAIKYTPRGQVSVSADKAENGVYFSVTDSGIGISKADQEKVYDKFFRSEDFRTRQAKGTGLGLYVTMKLARLINAELKLTSQLNKGSTFSVYVPNLK